MKYEVIADYPNSPYNVGDLVEFSEVGTSFHCTTTKEFDQFREDISEVENYVSIGKLDDWPHLFKSLDESQPPTPQRAEEDKSGVEIIAAERSRQVLKKGYDKDHDEYETSFQLSSAAGMFIANALNKDFFDHTHYDDLGNCARFQIREMDTKKWAEVWPWEDHDGREKADVLTSLIKAGALIAAEIDRLNDYDPQAMESYRNQPKDDRIDKAIEWVNEKCIGCIEGTPFSVKALTPYDAYKEVKQYLLTLKQQP